MNRIDTMFSKLKEKNEKAFIPFLTAGDPTIEDTKKMVLEMEKKGADLIELGIPFSDPIAEGPVIQEANIRALKNNVNLDVVFDMVKDLRLKIQTPFVFLMYYNSIYKYGLERFFQNCKECGVDGVIIPDLPCVEMEEIREYTQKYNVYQICLVAPSSTEERIKEICKYAKGFIYCVSSMGVTGERDRFLTDFNKMFKILNESSQVPKCIGFGISTTQHVKQLATFADGLIVGSAIVKKSASSSNTDERVKAVGEYVEQMKTEILKY